MHTEYTKINSHVQLCSEKAAKTRWPGSSEWRDGGGREIVSGAGEGLGVEERCWRSDGGEWRWLIVMIMVEVVMGKVVMTVVVLTSVEVGGGGSCFDGEGGDDGGGSGGGSHSGKQRSNLVVQITVNVAALNHTGRKFDGERERVREGEYA